MPKKVPSQFTGRFSVNPKKSSTRTKNVSASLSSAKESAPLREHLKDEPVPSQVRKRKLSGKESGGSETRISPQPSDNAEVSNVYGQQLEEQPPTKTPKTQMNEQTILQDQTTVVTRESGPNDSRASERISNREPETFPLSFGIHQYHEEALAILRNGWQSRGISQPDITGIARSLADRAATVPDAETILFPRYVPRAILDYASQQPQAIDYMLQAFCASLKLLPNSLTNRGPGGTEATITQMKWLLIEHVHGFDGFLLPGSPAIIDQEDHSNVKFQPTSVSSHLEGVLRQIGDWRWQRRMWFIAAAGQARCFSLDILRKRVGQQIEALIDAGLNPKRKRWSKVDMIGACILLRGCANSLKAHVPTSKVKIFAWKASLERFLSHDEDDRDHDFVIKAHAAVRNPPLAWRYILEIWLTRISFH